MNETVRDFLKDGYVIVSSRYPRTAEVLSQAGFKVLEITNMNDSSVKW